jgi:hypothetical protein
LQKSKNYVEIKKKNFIKNQQANFNQTWYMYHFLVEGIQISSNEGRYLLHIKPFIHAATEEKIENILQDHWASKNSNSMVDS